MMWVVYYSANTYLNFDQVTRIKFIKKIKIIKSKGRSTLQFLVVYVED